MPKSNNPYLLYYKFTETDAVKMFLEIISNNYISKKIDENLILLLGAEGEDSKAVYKKLISSMPEDIINKSDIVVTKFNSFYGTLSKSVWDWLDENVNLKWIDKQNI